MTDRDDIRMPTVVTLPPAYSEKDAKARKQALEDLADLERAFRDEAKPILDRLCEIERRYPPRIVLA